MMQQQPDLFEAAPPPGWTPPKGKMACGRDPAMGPGTCWHWWEGCPKAEKRGCYSLWRKQQHEAQKK